MNTYTIPFNASHGELKPHIANLWMKHIVAMIIKSRMQFDARIIWPRIGCDFKKFNKFFLYFRAQFIVADGYMISHLYSTLDRKLFWILMRMANEKCRRIHQSVFPIRIVVIVFLLRIKYICCPIIPKMFNCLGIVSPMCTSCNCQCKLTRSPQSIDTFEHVSSA